MELKFGFKCGRLDFEVYDDGTIIAYKLYEKWRRIANKINFFARFFCREIGKVEFKDLEEFMKMYMDVKNGVIFKSCDEVRL